MATITTLANKIMGKKTSFAYQFTVGATEYVIAAYYKFDTAESTPLFGVWNLTDPTQRLVTGTSMAGGECYPVTFKVDLLDNGRLACVNRKYYMEIDPASAGATPDFSHVLPGTPADADRNVCQGINDKVIICSGTNHANMWLSWCDQGGANWVDVQLALPDFDTYLRRPCSMLAADGDNYAFACKNKGNFVIAVNMITQAEQQVAFAGATTATLYQGLDNKIYVQVTGTGAGWYTLDAPAGTIVATPSGAPPGYYHQHYTDETIWNKWFVSSDIEVDKTNIIPNTAGEVSISYSGLTKTISGVTLDAQATRLLSPPHHDGYCIVQGGNYGPLYKLLNEEVTFLGYDNRNGYFDKWSPNHDCWWRTGYDKKVAKYLPGSSFTATPLSTDAALLSLNPARKVVTPSTLAPTSDDDHFLFPVVDAVDKKIYFSIRSRPRMLWYDPVADTWGALVLTNDRKVFDSDIMHIKSIRGGHFIAISSRDQDIGLLTLDVAPSTAWEADDLITGQTSGAMLRVVAKLTDLTYTVKGWNGVNFTLGEVLTNGTYTADQGTSYPTLVGYGDWIGRLYLFNVLDQAVQKVLTITAANADPTLVDIGILVEVGDSLTDNGHVIAVRGNLASDSKTWRINTHAIMPSAVVWKQDITGNAFNLVATGTNEYCDLEVASDSLVYLMVGTDLKSIDPADGTVSAAVSISGGSIPATSKLRWVGDTLYAYGADANMYPIAGIV